MRWRVVRRLRWPVLIGLALVVAALTTTTGSWRAWGGPAGLTTAMTTATASGTASPSAVIVVGWDTADDDDDAAGGFASDAAAGLSAGGPQAVPYDPSEDRVPVQPHRSFEELMMQAAAAALEEEANATARRDEADETLGGRRGPEWEAEHRRALEATAAFTGRHLLTVPHPLGNHTSFSLLRCAGAAPARDGAGGTGGCLCRGGEDAAIAAECFPRFDPTQLAQPRAAAPASAKAGSGDPPLNVVVISMGAARWDAFSFNGARHPRPVALASATMPNELMRHVNHPAHPGMVFRNAFAPAPWTLPSQASLLSGFLPDATGVFDDDHMIKVPLLGHHLGRRYCRVAYVSDADLAADDADVDPDANADPGSMAGRPRRAFGWTGSQGWDHYQQFRQAADAEGAALQFLRARALNGTATAPLAGCDGTPGQPYLLVAQTNRMQDTGLDPLRYLQRASEVDLAVAALLDDIDFATTVVVLTSDHGEGFEPNLGRLGHRGRVHNDLVRAPLVVWHPLLAYAKDTVKAFRMPTDPRMFHDGAVSLVSAVPTLLAWTGHVVPPYLAAAGRLPMLRAADPGRRDHAAAAGPGAAVVTAVDRTYAVAVVERGPHRWLGPFDLLASPHAPPAHRRAIVADDVEVRMTIQWPLKLITTRINGTLAYAVYNLTADPNEVDNGLGDRGLLPNPLAGTDGGSKDPTVPFEPAASFFARMAQLTRAIGTCVPLVNIGVATVDQLVNSEKRPDVVVAIRLCADIAAQVGLDVDV